jgi:serine/threonine protein kinase
MVSQSRSVLQPLRRWDPERIGPYAIIGKLGAGAMGQVFLARSAAGRLVAVKTIRVELAEEPGFRTRFAREVAAARQVSGVFTASVIEADAEADLPWVATAYVPAPSLSALVRQCGPLPVPAVRWLAAGSAEALQSIHGAGLLHRDVKPSNVLVALDGPRVIDFGVARATERIELTAARGAVGTPAYMAPEQARDATRASPASDVFSLGATLVFAATGHSPYQGETVMDTLVRLATEAPDLTGVPEELTDLLSACLERVPRDRPTNAAILANLSPFAIPASADHAYLPDSALTLIADYQHDAHGLGQNSLGSPSHSSPSHSSHRSHRLADFDDPGDAVGYEDSVSSATDGSGFQMAAGADGASGATSGSHTALPGFESPSAFRAGQEPPPPDPGWGRGRLLARARRQWLVLVIMVAGLLAAGVGIGIALDRTSSMTLGPVMSPPRACVAQAAGTPQLCVSQSSGDNYTVFIVHGTGFPPMTQVTIRLVSGRTSRTSPEHPTTDWGGTFGYAIDQGHEFFSGSIPVGTYTAVATTPNGSSAHASFQVHPPPPPPGPPPGGGIPPGSGVPPGSGAPPGLPPGQ